MSSPIVFECAATYLYAPVRAYSPAPVEKKKRKVEAVVATYTGKKFNKEADKKAKFDQHIDLAV